jgi:hypothetical protein
MRLDQTTPLSILFALFRHYGIYWHVQPSLQRFATLLLQHTKQFMPRDSENLLAFEEGDIHKMSPFLESANGHSGRRRGGVIRREEIRRPTGGSYYLVIYFFEMILFWSTPVEVATKDNKRIRFARPKAYKAQWEKLRLCVEYVEMMLSSRECRLVFHRWLKNNTEFEKTRAQYQAAKDNCLSQLMQITASAAHLRLVQRHIMRFRPEWLNDTLLNKPLYGPFFRSRLLGQQLAALSSRHDTIARVGLRHRAHVKLSEGQEVPGFIPSEIIQATQRGTEAQDKEPNKGGTILKCRPLTLWEEAMCVSQLHEYLAQKNQPQTKGGWELLDEPMDIIQEQPVKGVFLDEFIPSVCYGMRMLSVQQCERLAEIFLSCALDTTRSMPERVKFAIRFTLLPSVNYADIITVIEGQLGLGVNLEETFLKGTMYNDEPLAPMHYLLRPQLLSSDRARVAAYALPRATSLMKPDACTRLLTLVLHRKALKVTVHKQIIRMLAWQPTEAHIALIEREWGREKLHRDVRVVILQHMIKFLAQGHVNQHISDSAWRILESCVTSPSIADEIEVLAVLCAVTDGSTPPPDHTLSAMILSPQLVKQYGVLIKVSLPPSICQKYAEQVVIPLCERVTRLPQMRSKSILSAQASSTEMVVESPKDGVRHDSLRQDDDIAFIMTASLPIWMKYGIRTQGFQLLQDCIGDVRPEYLLNDDLCSARALRERFTCMVRICATDASEDAMRVLSLAVQDLYIVYEQVSSCNETQRAAIKVELMVRLTIIGQQAVAAVTNLSDTSTYVKSSKNEVILSTPSLAASMASAGLVFFWDILISSLSHTTAVETSTVLAYVVSHLATCTQKTEQGCLETQVQKVLLKRTVEFRTFILDQLVSGDLAQLAIQIGCTHRGYEQLQTAACHLAIRILALLNKQYADASPSGMIALLDHVCVNLARDTLGNDSRAHEPPYGSGYSKATAIALQDIIVEAYNNLKEHDKQPEGLKRTLETLASITLGSPHCLVTCHQSLSDLAALIKLEFALGLVTESVKMWIECAPKAFFNLVQHIALPLLRDNEVPSIQSYTCASLTVQRLADALLSAYVFVHHLPKESDVHEHISRSRILLMKDITQHSSPRNMALFNHIWGNRKFLREQYLMLQAVGTEWTALIQVNVQRHATEAIQPLCSVPGQLQFMHRTSERTYVRNVVSLFSVASRTCADMSPLSSFFVTATNAIHLALSLVREQGTPAPSEAVHPERRQLEALDLSVLHLAINMLQEEQGQRVVCKYLPHDELLNFLTQLWPLAMTERVVEEYVMSCFQIVKRIGEENTEAQLGRRVIEALLSLGIAESAMILPDAFALHTQVLPYSILRCDLFTFPNSLLSTPRR